MNTVQSIMGLWKMLGRTASGRWIFSQILGRAAPYTGSIHARVEVLEKGRCKVRMADRRAVRNHFRSIHALALMNLGEMATGLAMYSIMPPQYRGIPVHLEIDFFKKARGWITADAQVSAEAWIPDQTRILEAELKNGEGEVVAKVRAHWKIGAMQIEKKS